MISLARIIAVVSGKGGVGKTTVAMNLAAVLSQRYRKKVTVIDCNVTTAHLGLSLGMYHYPITLNNILRGESRIRDATYEHFSGMQIIPASISLSDMDEVDLTDLRKKLRSISKQNDIIILDSGPGIGREALACLNASDEVLYVANPYITSIMDIIRIQEIVNILKLKPIGIVLNMVEGKKYEMRKEDVHRLTGLPVIASVPFDKNVKKSLSQNLPVIALNPFTGASKAFYRLAPALIGEYYVEEGRVSSALRRLGLKRS